MRRLTCREDGRAGKGWRTVPRSSLCVAGLGRDGLAANAAPAAEGAAHPGRRRQPVGRVRPEARQRLGRAARAAPGPRRAARQRRQRQHQRRHDVRRPLALPPLLQQHKPDARDHRTRRQRCAARPAARGDPAQPRMRWRRTPRPPAPGFCSSACRCRRTTGAGTASDFAALFANVARAEGAALVPVHAEGCRRHRRMRNRCSSPTASIRSRPPTRSSSPTSGRCWSRCCASRRGPRCAASRRASRTAKAAAIRDWCDAGHQFSARLPPRLTAALHGRARPAAFRTPLPAIRLGARLRRGGPGARRLGRSHRRCDLRRRRRRCPFRPLSRRRRGGCDPRLRRRCVRRRLGSRWRTRPGALRPLAPALGATVLLRRRLLRDRLCAARSVSPAPPEALQRGRPARVGQRPQPGAHPRALAAKRPARLRTRIGQRLRGGGRISPVATAPIVGRGAHLRRGSRCPPAASLRRPFVRTGPHGLARAVPRQSALLGLWVPWPAARAPPPRRLSATAGGTGCAWSPDRGARRLRPRRAGRSGLPLGIAGGAERPRLDAARRRRRRDADRRRLHRDDAAGLVDDRAHRWQVARARGARRDRFAIRQHVGRHHGHRVRVLAIRVVALRTARVADDDVDVRDVANVREVDLAHVARADPVGRHVDLARREREPADRRPAADRDRQLAPGPPTQATSAGA